MIFKFLTQTAPTILCKSQPLTESGRKYPIPQEHLQSYAKKSYFTIEFEHRETNLLSIQGERKCSKIDKRAEQL